MEKILIFDSGPLINLSMNGLLYILERLKEKFSGKFIITEQVKYEILDRPLQVQKFELEALGVKDLIDRKIIEMASSLEINQQELNQKTKEFMRIANSSVEAEGKRIDIVSEAEMSCLALSDILSERGIDNIIAIDERTTRLLSEKPENLEKLMSKKLDKKVRLIRKNFNEFSKFRFIRSSELVYVACKKELLHIKGPKVLEAALFATKFKGSSISWDEINELKRL